MWKQEIAIYNGRLSARRAYLALMVGENEIYISSVHLRRSIWCSEINAKDCFFKPKIKPSEPG